MLRTGTLSWYQLSKQFKENGFNIIDKYLNSKPLTSKQLYMY